MRLESLTDADTVILHKLTYLAGKNTNSTIDVQFSLPHSTDIDLKVRVILTRTVDQDERDMRNIFEHNPTPTSVRDYLTQSNKTYYVLVEGGRT